MSSAGSSGIGPQKGGKWSRMKQGMLEAVGKRDKTELNEEFQTRCNQIEEHRECVQALWDSSMKIVQPDSKLLDSGVTVCDTTKYDDMVQALMKIQKESMAQPTSYAQFMGAAAYAYSQLAASTKQYQVDTHKECGTLIRFIRQYCEQLTMEKIELNKRRLEMDDAKARVQGAKSMEKLSKTGETYDELIKAFEEQANKVLALMDTLPEKKDHHRRAIRKMMEVELKWHEEAAGRLRKGIQDCIAMLGIAGGTSTSSSVHSPAPV